uniref:N-acetyltransferase domain-containing protein n=1 Tax=Chromera velia CCMP2878 TaxID=1169474 RepID=A0A0G4FCI5_9ALVE|eukprot:Cvel_16335.t1-p1 / transcript=Cvel_16335.t1 / gene=Cvel_16335 / organism=Chromera_velia_CCMP2878 / gene_product=N-acyltransferase YncA, putative / transcript_product=N-acyltransferase YncA, putative / location=Cvel_scaffold1253:47404-48129(+) / protein_length=242 / sequence_SO=supercontig / SO=protein_coding / is_pseudo=false
MGPNTFLGTQGGSVVALVGLTCVSASSPSSASAGETGTASASSLTETVSASSESREVGLLPVSAGRHGKMGGDFEIRLGCLEDAGSIASIYNESIDRGDSTMDEQRKSAEDIRRWMGGMGSRERFLVAVSRETDALGKGKVIGWVVIKQYSDREGYRFACETSIYVTRGGTGGGVGSCLQAAAIRDCRELRYHHIVVRIFDSNRGSVKFHEKLGFETVGIQKEIGWKHGQWKDIRVMQLVLR